MLRLKLHYGVKRVSVVQYGSDVHKADFFVCVVFWPGEISILEHQDSLVCPQTTHYKIKMSESVIIGHRLWFLTFSLLAKR